MDKTGNLIKDITGIGINVQHKILYSLLIIFILWIIRFLLLRIVFSQTKDIKTRYLWRSTLSYLIPFIGIFLIGAVWFEGVKQIGAFLGIFSAGVAIALKDPVTNIAGWAFIIIRKPFSVGDRIQMGNSSGDVIDIRLFQFTIIEIGNWVDADQSTGRIIHIPNGKIFTEAQANFSKGFQYIWNEIPVLLTFESNWKKAKEILQDIAKKHAEHLSTSAEKRIIEASKKFMIFYKHLTPIVYTSVKDSGVLLTIRYLCDPRKRRGSLNDIWEDILEAFDQNNDIDFAYPTQRFYRLNEKK